jgi:hypothetical protein
MARPEARRLDRPDESELLTARHEFRGERPRDVDAVAEELRCDSGLRFDGVRRQTRPSGRHRFT